MRKAVNKPSLAIAVTMNSGRIMPQPNFLKRLAVSAGLPLMLGLAALLPAPMARADAAGDARQALFNEDFAGARELLAAAPDDSDSAALRRVIDECELDAVCERASAMLAKGERVPARATLEDAVARLPSGAAAAPRARGLLALARAGESGDTQRYKAFLKKLDDLIAECRRDETKRRELAAAALQACNAALAAGRDLLASAQAALSKYEVDSANSAFRKAEDEAKKAADALARVKPLLDEAEYKQAAESSLTEIEAVRDRVAEGLSKIAFEMRDYVRAANIADARLRENPDNRRLRELRVLIQEYWRHNVFDDGRGGLPR